MTLSLSSDVIIPTITMLIYHNAENMRQSFLTGEQLLQVDLQQELSASLKNFEFDLCAK